MQWISLMCRVADLPWFTLVRKHVRVRLVLGLYFASVVLGALPRLAAQTRELHVTQQYLNVPIGRQAKSRIFTISAHGAAKRAFPLQLAEGKVNYWVYLDITNDVPPAAVDKELSHSLVDQHLHRALAAVVENRPFTFNRIDVYELKSMWGDKV